MFLHKHFSANNMVIEKFPFLRELAMEAYILENESVLSLETDGFSDVSIVKSEVTLLKGRKIKDGRIDILATYGQEYIAVVELKKGLLTEKHLEQLEDYLEKKEQILDKFSDVWDESVSNNPKWIGVMVGETIESNLMLKIREGHYFNKDIPIAALAINRFRGHDGNIYVVTDTYFTDKKIKNKDYTKYLFDGRKYGKGRLVQAVIKGYVESNPEIEYNELLGKFPDKLQGRDGVFITEGKAINIYQTTGYKRHFIEPEEIVKIKGATIAVCSQWGIGNIVGFINHCNEILHLKIETITS